MFSVQLREACEEAVNDLIERQALAIGDDPLAKKIGDEAFAQGVEEGLKQRLGFVSGPAKLDDLTESFGKKKWAEGFEVAREKAAEIAEDFDCSSRPAKACCGSESEIAEMIRGMKP